LVFTSIHFLLFNIGDFGGRLLLSFPSLIIWSGPSLLLLSLLRIGFIPLFLLCNVQSRGSVPSAVVFGDAWFMIILLAFGATNGWLSTLVMVAAPNADRNPQLKGRREDVETAATVASFCLVAGLAGGSIMSFAVRAMMCKCNPLVG
jgi:equilibrative nucleoside transporter 1/2/3